MQSVKLFDMNFRAKYFGCFALLLIAIAPQLGFAQATGTLEGYVSDNSNAAIADAKITITSSAQKYEVAVNKEGKFSIMLPVGEYNLVAQAKAFRQSEKKLIKVMAEQTTEMSLALDIDYDYPFICILTVTGTVEKKTTEKKESTKSEDTQSIKKDKGKGVKTLTKYRTVIATKRRN